MNITTDYGYSAGGKLLTSEKTYRGTNTYTTSHAYDEHNYPASDTAPNGQVTNYGLNASKEKMLSVSSPLDSENLANNFDYDGDLVKTLAHNGTTFAFAYDGRNNIASINIGNGVFTQNKDVTYNENGTCVSKTTYGNGQIVTKYYNKYDKLVMVTSTESGKTTTLLVYLYNDNDTDEKPLLDASGKPCKDSAGNPLTEKITDPFDTALVCSENSPLRTIIDGNSRHRCTYTSADEPASITADKVGVKIEVRDKFGRVTNKVVFSNLTSLSTTMYSYENNVDNTLAQETTISTNEIVYSAIYTRDTLRRLKTATYKAGNSGYEVDYFYKPRQQIIKKPSKPGQISFGDEIVDVGTTNFVQQLAYYKIHEGTRTYDCMENITYDENGNITSYGDVTYSYDKLSRLVREDNPNLDKTIVWEYNNTRNPIKRTEYPYTTDTVGTATKTYILTYNSSWRDQVSAINGQTVNYDRAGNPTKYRDMIMSWTRGRLLASCYKNGATITYKYDGNGLRCEKSRNVNSENTITTQFLLDNNGRMVREKRSGKWSGEDYSKTLHYIYCNTGIMGFRVGVVSTYLYRRNFLGDITAIYKNNKCVAKYVYDANGVCKVLNPDGTENTNAEFIGNINPIRYRGYYYDVETGFYYCGSRYFVPQLGLWLNHDDMLDKQDTIHTTSSITTVKAMAVVATATKNEEKPADSPFKGWICKTTDTSFFAGFDSDESANPISWLQYKMFYVDAGILRGSLFDVKVAVMSLTFRTPDALGRDGISRDRDSHAYLNIDVLAAEGSLALGSSGKLKLVSAEAGFQIAGFISFGAEAYVGYGKSVKYSDGEFRFGVGNGFGFEFSVKVDIAKLINIISEWFR